MISSTVFSEPILVGRKKEIEQLELCLKSAVAGKGKTVFISGEAGSGKTKLVTEFLKKAQSQKITILEGWCLSNARIPFFPFIEAFKEFFAIKNKNEIDTIKSRLPKSQLKKKQSMISSEELDVKKWLVGPIPLEEFGESSGLTPQVWKEQAFTIIEKTLSTISDQKTTIFFIDDIHWSDSASIALINYLSHSIQSKRVLFIATYRIEQLFENKEGTLHPLVETIRLMRRGDLLNEIKIRSLDKKSVYTLAKNMLGGDLRPEFAEKITKESQGNPLYVVESLRMLHELGDLIQEDSQWRLVQKKLEMPTKIKDIILQRLGVLTLNQRRVLEVASVIGEKFDHELVASVLNSDMIETIRILDRIAKKTSLITFQGDQYKFDHSRSRDVIYDEIPIPLKKIYHEKIGENLINISKEKLPYSDLAYHFAKAEKTEKAVKYALAAGKDALLRWTSIHEAVKHFTYVISVIGDNPKFSKIKIFTLEALGDAFYGNNMFREAATTFEDLAKTTKKNDLKLRAYRKALESAFQIDDSSLFNRFLSESKKFSTADSLENAKILIGQGRFFAKQNMIPEALENFKAALKIFEENYSLWDMAWTLSGIGAFNVMLNKSEEGIFETLRAIKLFEELDLDSRWPKEEYYAVGNTANFNVKLAELAIRELNKIRQEPKGREYARVQGNVMFQKELAIGNEVEMRLDLVNIGRESALMVKIEDVIPKCFNIINMPSWCDLKDGSLVLNQRKIEGFEVKTIKLILEPVETGTFYQNPFGLFIDDLGERRTFELNPIKLLVKPTQSSSYIKPDRASSGLKKLDDLMLGGIPRNYAIILTATPSDERDYLIKNFLEAGTKSDEITFYVTTEVDDLTYLLKKTNNFYLFLCNRNPKTQIPDLQNVYKVKGKTDLTNLSISMAKAYRTLDQSKNKRICIDIVSDVLLKHTAEPTRRWVSELISNLSSKGFTMLFVINPLMHASEDLHAVLDLFDGEINLIQNEDPFEYKKFIQIKKLRNKDYKKNPINIKN